jgi:putative hemolysin
MGRHPVFEHAVADAALHELPPLIRGYLRLVAYVGDGAVIDHHAA